MDSNNLERLEIISQWEKQFVLPIPASGRSSTDGVRPPAQSALALWLADICRCRECKGHLYLTYNASNKEWHTYDKEFPGLYGIISQKDVEAFVYRQLKELGYTAFSASYVSGVVRLLRLELTVRE